MTNPNPNPNHIPNRVNGLWKNKPKNMAAAGIRTRVTSWANRDATRYATAPTLQASFVVKAANDVTVPIVLPAG